MRKGKQDELLQQALAKLKPQWALFKLLTSKEWAWEFLKRNPGFLADSRKIEKGINQEVEDYMRQLGAVDIISAFDKEFIRMRIEWDFAQREDIRKAVHKYGLYCWANPKHLRPPSGLFWLEEISGKDFSDYFLEQSFDENRREIKNLKLTENEDCLIINYNTPWQIYMREIIRRYGQRGKLENLKQFFLDRYPDYLKIYDLRNWKEDKSGKPVLSWSTIRDYIAEGKKMSIQTIKKRYEAAERLINGEYKELVKYSPASPHSKDWSIRIIGDKAFCVSDDGDVVDTGTLAERLVNLKK